jgi:N-acetylglucosaminyldiphosphoundecaprenol N-acetyl-beta-D-mannosaminyltransferase
MRPRHGLQNTNRIEFLDCPLDNLTMAETLEHISKAIKTRTQLQHVVVNVAKLMAMRRDQKLRKAVIESDLINIDGMGIVYGCRLLGHDVKERIAGIDLMGSLLGVCENNGWRPYFLGAKQETLERAMARIRQKHPNLEIAGCRNGYFEKVESAAIAKSIAESEADCLFIAISSPMKEEFLNNFRDTLNVPFLMGVGGSLDVIAGDVTRAPQLFQRWGFEWLWRFAQEPQRMWRRYAQTNTEYLILLGQHLAISIFVKTSSREKA